MKIYVDADGCPVVSQTEKVAQEYGIAVILVCDTSHILSSDHSEIIIADKGNDSADFVIVSKCQKGDIVVTQDYGVAAMALGKGAFPIHQNGKWYTNENIDSMLMQRHIARTARRSKKAHIKGPSKRTEEDNIRFIESLERLVVKVMDIRTL